MTGLPFPAKTGGPLLHPWQGRASDLVDAAVGQAPLWWLRGSRMRTKAGLMDEWAAVAQFPPHFGGTWDALRDALADLPEGGTFLILDAEQLLQEAPPGEFTTLVELLTVVREELSPKGFQLILQAEAAQFETLVAGLKALGP